MSDAPICAVEVLHGRPTRNHYRVGEPYDSGTITRIAVDGLVVTGRDGGTVAGPLWVYVYVDHRRKFRLPEASCILEYADD